MSGSALSSMLEAEARIARNLSLRAERAIAHFTELANHGPDRTCPICGYVGPFSPVRHKPSIWCPSCDSRPRHRLIKLWLDQNDLSGSRILHFAPEPSLGGCLEEGAELYRTADIRDAFDLQLDLTAIDLPDGCYDVIMANHVLEHLDDHAALREIHRVLSDKGIALLTVPLVAGWTETFDDPDITTAEHRALHYTDPTHLRFYGRDFATRVASAGFVVEEFTASGKDVATYALHRGETLYVARKS